MEIAIATRTAPAQWWDETDEVLSTVIDVLDQQAERAKRKRRR